MDTDATLTALGIPVSHHDLLSRPLVATLSTIGGDGLVQSTAVWFLADEGELRVSVRTDRQKHRNVLANPVATLLVVDPDGAARTVEVRARVEVRDDPGAAAAQRFAPTYGDAPSAWDPPGVERVMLVLHPVRVVVLG